MFQEASQICRMTGARMMTAQQRGSQGHHCSQGKVPMLGKGDTRAQACSPRPVMPPERQKSSSLTSESLKSALKLPHISGEGTRCRRRGCTLTQGAEMRLRASWGGLECSNPTLRGMCLCKAERLHLNTL